MADNNRESPCEFDRSHALRRRRLLSILSTGALLVSPLPSEAGTAAQNSNEAIAQPEAPSDMAYIQRAFEMRRLAIDYGDQAYGAVVVRHGRIIGQSWSRVILDQDPTGHAEMSAIRDAAHRLNSRVLSGSILYSSSRPCPMCEAAAYWAGIKQMYHGAVITDAGPPRLTRC